MRTQESILQGDAIETVGIAEHIGSYLNNCQQVTKKKKMTRKKKDITKPRGNRKCTGWKLNYNLPYNGAVNYINSDQHISQTLTLSKLCSKSVGVGEEM